MIRIEDMIKSITTTVSFIFEPEMESLTGTDVRTYIRSRLMLSMKSCGSPPKMDKQRKSTIKRYHDPFLFVVALIKEYRIAGNQIAVVKLFNVVTQYWS